MSEVGHNSDGISDAAQRQLRQYIEQLEQLETEKAAIGDDLKEKFAEMKGAGYDIPTVKRLLKLRKMDPDKRSEQDALMDTYLHALGMLADTPLGKYAMERDGVSGTAH